MMNNLMGPLGMLLAGMAIADVPYEKCDFYRKTKLSVGCVAAAVVSGTWITGCDEKHFRSLCTWSVILSQILLTVYLACVTPACAYGDFHGTAL